MKSIVVFVLFAGVVASCSAPKQEEKESNRTTPVTADDGIIIQEQADADTLKGSLRSKAVGAIGAAHFTIRYHSPAVRGRIVWGGLVPFDRVWVTGAHMATSLEVDQDVVIGGTAVPAGKYGLFTIPGKDAWTIIINRNWEQHLTDEYDEKEDVLRLTVKPEQESTNQERLRYVIESESENEGEIVVYWEKLEVSLAVSVKK